MHQLVNKSTDYGVITISALVTPEVSSYTRLLYILPLLKVGGNGTCGNLATNQDTTGETHKYLSFIPLLAQWDDLGIWIMQLKTPKNNLVFINTTLLR
jgi:hypothetical protein